MILQVDPGCLFAVHRSNIIGILLKKQWSSWWSLAYWERDHHMYIYIHYYIIIMITLQWPLNKWQGHSQTVAKIYERKTAPNEDNAMELWPTLCSTHPCGGCSDFSLILGRWHQCLHWFNSCWWPYTTPLCFNMLDRDKGGMKVGLSMLTQGML